MPTTADSGLSGAPFFIVMNAGSGDKDADGREATIRQVLTEAGRPHRIWRISDIKELAAAAEDRGTRAAAARDRGCGRG